MINIRKITDISEEIRIFQTNQWKLADMEYYGEVIDWTKEKISLTATDDKKLIGVMECTVQAGVMNIETLIVDHEKHHRGIGTKLMEKAEEIARNRGVHKIFLNTSKTEKTNKFYESLGFEKTGEHPNHHKHKNYIIYSKFL